MTLSGTLSVSLVNGFMPTAGNSFQIITYMGTLAGDFTTDDFPAPGTESVGDQLRQRELHPDVDLDDLMSSTGPIEPSAGRPEQTQRPARIRY